MGDGAMQNVPDTTGPVCITVEVHQVVPACSGPVTIGWKGVESLQRERQRAEELEAHDAGRHKHKALQRWRRIIAWLEIRLKGLRWKVQDGTTTGGSSMYDFDWDDDQDGHDEQEQANAESKQ